MANDYVTVGAQRSRHFGPAGTHIQRGNDITVSNLDSDLFFPGGPGDPDGIYNAIYVQEVPGDSLTAPDDGSSFIQVVTWPRCGACPVGSTILTYSESSNPASPHFADQTKLFSKKQFLPDRFCPSQIAADPNLQVTTVTGG